ncbi:MAG: hypothetical protein EOO77_36790, partial [Oxalobacteraceae bacterium]
MSSSASPRGYFAAQLQPTSSTLQGQAPSSASSSYSLHTVLDATATGVRTTAPAAAAGTAPAATTPKRGDDASPRNAAPSALRKIMFAIVVDDVKVRANAGALVAAASNAPTRAPLTRASHARRACLQLQTNRVLLARMLARRGVARVLEAEDGFRALDFAR